MAKASKSGSETPKTPRKKAPAKKAAQKPAAAPSNPLVDTSAAAAAAAKLVAGRKLLEKAQSDSGRESADFQQLKQSLTQPAGQALSNVLEKISPTSGGKSNLPTGQMRQVGHNQTQGGFNRAGVPRRTPG